MNTPKIKKHVVPPIMVVTGDPSIVAVSHDIWRQSEGIGLNMAKSSDVFSRRCKFVDGLSIMTELH